MKKIMGISLLAVFAVSPLMARADNVNLFTAPIGVTTDVATTSYVKGAYNELGTVINTKADKIDLDKALTEIGDVDYVGDSLSAAISALQSAQSSSDTNFNTALTDEVNRATAAELTLQNAITTEASTARAAEQANANAISNEAQARQGADTALSNRIDAIEAGVQGDYATKTGVAQTVNAATATGTVQIAQSINEKCDDIKSYVDGIIKASNDEIINEEVNLTEFYLSELISQCESFYADKLRLLKIDFEISSSFVT